MYFVTELMFGYAVAIQNRSKLHIMVLTSSAFFPFMSETKSDWTFGFLCHEGRRGKGLDRTTNKYIAPT